MVGGAFIRCIEVFERGYLSGQAQRDAYYVDSLITYRGVSTTSISGLGHLEGRRVSIWGNGAVMVDAIVVNGTITLESPVSVAQIGLPYRHRLRTLKLNVGGRAGTSLGRLKRINALVFFLLNSHTMHYGPSVDRMTGIGFRRVSNLMDVGVPLFSGEWEVDFESSWDTDARLIIESSDPAPFTLLAIGAEVTQHELK